MDGATIRGAAATICGQRVTAWQGATGHRRDRAEVHQGKPADDEREIDADGEQADADGEQADAAKEQADAAALVAVVDQADADGEQADADGDADDETGDAGRSQFGGG